jgi:hypothetical protein
LYVLSCTIRYIFSPLIMRKIRSTARGVYNIHDASDSAFSFQVFWVSIKPIQVKYEIAKLLEIVAGLRPRDVLEIGTAGGGKLFLFTRAADLKCHDYKHRPPGRALRLRSGYPKWKIALYKSFTIGGRKSILRKPNQRRLDNRPLCSPKPWRSNHHRRSKASGTQVPYGV